MQPKLDPNILLAKSTEKPWRGAYTLVGHTSAVVEAVTTLVDTLGDRLISQFSLQCNFSQLRATARLAAYLHDWGKANDHFQGVVRYSTPGTTPQRNPLKNPQLLRHEVASVLLAWEYREWLQQCDGDFFTALVAAGGHHLKLGGNVKDGDTGELGKVRDGSGSDRLYLYTSPKHFKGLLKYGVKTLGLPQKLPNHLRKPPTCWQITELKQKREKVLDELLEWKHDPTFTAVIKALIIAGDAVGSALPSTGLKITDWMGQQVRQTLSEPELQKVIKAKLNGQELLDFQKALRKTSKRVTLVRAGCGTGKTLGAYNWGLNYASGRKLFFCYPTTGTSTEGFIDYVHSKVEAVLLHSRAAVDLEHLMKTGDEDDLEIKLESFKAWGAKVSICTVDTVLGLLQCNRRPLYCFPAIAQAAFVFDEVHCYDDRLFGTLLRFLEVVKAPILLMSASFLPWQIAAIEKAVSEPIENIRGENFKELKEIEELPRYRFHLVDVPDWKRVEQELRNGGKVLWVCNQVGTAIAIYQEAENRGLNALLYHSRYRYKDRVEHHRDVVDAFKRDEPVLAIATQVAEMSLDLSATLLVSQLADPAGLIQRLGRLNRRYCGDALDAIFYRPDSNLPYTQEELNAGELLVQTFTAEVSQANLSAWLEQSDFRRNPKKNAVLLDGKWKTYPESLREAGYTTTALLEQDLLIVESLKRKELPQYTIPLPTQNTKGWNRHKTAYLIAPANQWGYSSELGAYKLQGGEKQ